MAKSMIDKAGRAGASLAGGRRLLFWAGVATAALGLGAALLPLIEAHGIFVGWLLLAAGTIELIAASGRRPDEARETMRSAGAVTLAAGLAFLLDQAIGLYSVIYVVMVWLLARGAVMTLAAMRARGAACRWALFGAAADLALGLILLIGLPIAALVAQLFGPTPELVSRFAFILAVSFLVTGFSEIALARRGFGGEDDGQRDVSAPD